MKKLLASLLSVMMVVCFMSGMAWANGEAETGAVSTSDAFLQALAGEAETITVSGTIELSQPITISRSVKIVGADENAGLKASSSMASGSSNFITVSGGEDVSVTFENLKLESGENNKSTLHIYNSAFTGKNLTVTHGGVGAPVLVNHSSEATFTDELNLVLNASSWYGMNVDSSKANLEAATLSVTSSGDGFGATQSAVCAEGTDPTVTGVDLTVVKTAKHGNAEHVQIAYVMDENLSAFVEAKTNAGADVTEIELQRNVELSSPLTISEALTLKGNGHTVSGPEAEAEETPWNLVTVTGSNVKIENITLKTGTANKSALHVYKTTDTVVENIVLDTTTTSGGTGIVVNGAAVTVNGKIDFQNGENTWGGINVDTRNGNASVAFAKDAAVTSSGDKAVIYQDENENQTGTVTITGAEDAGLKTDSNGDYIIKPAEPVNPPVYPTTPTTQKPVIEPNADVTTSLSADGTTLTIKAKDGYEVVDVTVNGVSKGAVTELTGLKTGDKVVISTKKSETPDDTAAQIEAVKAIQLVARSANAKAPSGKKAIKVTWFEKNGKELNLDGYEIYRSTKKNSGYGTKPIYKTTKSLQYFNTSAKKGTRYYYKVRGYKTIGGEKIYTSYSLKAIRTAK